MPKPIDPDLLFAAWLHRQICDEDELGWLPIQEQYGDQMADAVYARLDDKGLLKRLDKAVSGVVAAFLS